MDRSTYSTPRNASRLTGGSNRYMESGSGNGNQDHPEMLWCKVLFIIVIIVASVMGMMDKILILCVFLTIPLF